MAEITKNKTRVVVEASMLLNEPELAALGALAEYGADAFLKHFYEHMGQAYLKPHEAGLRMLFNSIRRDVPSILESANTARQAVENA